VKEIRKEIEIGAPSRRVWGLLVDFERMPDRNPFIRSIAGTPEVGAQLEVHLAPPGGHGMTFRPTLLKVEPERELRWLGKL
jgi:uncharacterized membrane protein